MATYKKLLKDKDGNSIIPVTERDVYSTTEQVIGQWIDGKPIYRRVFTGTITNSANVRVQVSLWNNSPINKIVSIGGWMRYSTAGVNAFPQSEGGGEYRIAYVQSDSHNLMLAVLSASAYGNRPYEIWVEYTKSTD